MLTGFNVWLLAPELEFYYKQEPHPHLFVYQSVYYGMDSYFVNLNAYFNFYLSVCMCPYEGMSCVWTPVEVICHVCRCLDRSEEGARSLELGIGADPSL